MAEIKLCKGKADTVVYTSLKSSGSTLTFWNILDQAIALDGWTLFRDDRTQDCKRRRDCVYINYACCSITVKLDGGCLPDVAFLLLRYCPYYLET